MGMRLGPSLCVPHNCHCMTLVDAQDLHAMVCKKAPGKIARHHVFNDIIWRAVGAAGIPAVKEPSGLDRQDGKRPDGLTLIPWYGGRSLVWDVTVVSPLAASYVDRAATDAGSDRYDSQEEQQQQPFNGRLSGTTWVGRYQKKHSPAHTHHSQRTSFITFLHLQRSTASSLFSLRA